MPKLYLRTSAGDFQTIKPFESAETFKDYVNANPTDNIEVETLSGLKGSLLPDAEIWFVSTLDEFKTVMSKIAEQDGKVAVNQLGVPEKIKITVDREKDKVIMKLLTEDDEIVSAVAVDAQEFVKTLVTQLPNSVMDAIISEKENFQ